MKLNKLIPIVSIASLITLTSCSISQIVNTDACELLIEKLQDENCVFTNRKRGTFTFRAHGYSFFSGGSIVTEQKNFVISGTGEGYYSHDKNFGYKTNYFQFEKKYYESHFDNETSEDDPQINQEVYKIIKPNEKVYNKLRRSFEESPRPSRTEIYSEIFEAFMPLCGCDLVLTDYNLLRTEFKVYKADDNGSERYDLMPFTSPAIKVSLLFSQNPSIEVTCTTDCYYYLQLTHCPGVFLHDNTFPSSPSYPLTRTVTLQPWLDKCVKSEFGYTVIDEDNLHP